MKFNNSLRTFTLIAPFLVILFFLVQISLPANQGEFPENYFFLGLLLLTMVLNTISIIVKLITYSEKLIIHKFLTAFSLLFGTPIIVIFLIAYGNTFYMQVNLDKTKYLRNECFVKYKNIYKAENRYNFCYDYCNTATQDSIIVTEIYRWGTIKSCQVILDGRYNQIDTSKVTFLTNEQKKEIFSY